MYIWIGAYLRLGNQQSHGCLKARGPSTVFRCTRIWIFKFVFIEQEWNTWMRNGMVLRKGRKQCGSVWGIVTSEFIVSSIIINHGVDHIGGYAYSQLGVNAQANGLNMFANALWSHPFIDNMVRQTRWACTSSENASCWFLPPSSLQSHSYSIFHSQSVFLLVIIRSYYNNQP